MRKPTTRTFCRRLKNLRKTLRNRKKLSKNTLTRFGLGDTSRPPFSKSKNTIKIHRRSLTGSNVCSSSPSVISGFPRFLSLLATRPRTFVRCLTSTRFPFNNSFVSSAFAWRNSFCLNAFDALHIPLPGSSQTTVPVCRLPIPM